LAETSAAGAENRLFADFEYGLRAPASGCNPMNQVVSPNCALVLGAIDTRSVAALAADAV
jgi:hypothetical protein